MQSARSLSRRANKSPALGVGDIHVWRGGILRIADLRVSRKESRRQGPNKHMGLSTVDPRTRLGIEFVSNETRLISVKKLSVGPGIVRRTYLKRK